MRKETQLPDRAPWVLGTWCGAVRPYRARESCHFPEHDDAHARHLVPVPPLLEPVVEARLAAAHVEERVDEVGQPRAAPLQRKRVRGDRGAKAEREGHEADEDGEEEAPVARLELAPRRRRPVRRRGRQEVSRRDVAVARVAACRIARAEVAELELLLREQALPRQPLWSIGSRQTAPQGIGQPRDDSAASTAAMYRPSIAWPRLWAACLCWKPLMRALGSRRTPIAAASGL